MSDWKGRKKAESLKPFKGQEMRRWDARPNDDRFGSGPIAPENQKGARVWHGLVGAQRTGLPLPSTSKGPIRAREARRKKEIDGY